MSLKTKLSLGLGFLFLIIVALGVFSSFYVGKLGQDAENILKDNYMSIAYARNMLAAVEDMRTSIGSVLAGPGGTGTISDYYQRLFGSGRSAFEANLQAEKGNITEIREKDTVEALGQNYESFIKLCLQIKGGKEGGSVYLKDFLPAGEKLRQEINAIYDINMQAVERKSQEATRDASRFIKSMALVGTFCLIVAFGYFWYFPNYISVTLSYLSDRMKRLITGAGMTVDIKTNDEAFILMHGIGLLENKFGLKSEKTDGP